MVTVAPPETHLNQIRTILGLSVTLMQKQLETYTLNYAEVGKIPTNRSLLRRMMADAIAAYQAVSPMAMKHMDLLKPVPPNIVFVVEAPLDKAQTKDVVLEIPVTP